MISEPLFTFVSHDDKNKNRKVSVYPDRIEWILPRGVSVNKLLLGSMTMGLSLAVTGVRKSNGGGGSGLIPTHLITSISTQRLNKLNTEVTVVASDARTTFNVSHNEASHIKEALTELISGTHRMDVKTYSEQASANDSLGLLGFIRQDDRAEQRAAKAPTAGAENFVRGLFPGATALFDKLDGSQNNPTPNGDFNAGSALIAMATGKPNVSSSDDRVAGPVQGASSSSNPHDLSEQLHRLSQLFDSGALSQVEFESAKARLLGMN